MINLRKIYSYLSIDVEVDIRKILLQQTIYFKKISKHFQMIDYKFALILMNFNVANFFFSSKYQAN